MWLALNHQEPDRVPLDFGTGGNTSPVPEVYAGIAAHFGVLAPLRLIPHMMRLAQVDERILQALDIDTRPIYMNPSSAGRRPCDEPGAFYDDWGVKSLNTRWQMPVSMTWQPIRGGPTRSTRSATWTWARRPHICITAAIMR
jgi:hypothetical protein